MLGTSKSQASRTCLLPNGKLTTIRLRLVGAPHFPCRRSHGWGPTGRTRNIYRVGVVRKLEVKWSTWWCRRKRELWRQEDWQDKKWTDMYQLTECVCSTYPPANPHSLYSKHNSVYPWTYLRTCCVLEVYRVGLRSGVESMLLSH